MHALILIEREPEEDRDRQGRQCAEAGRSKREWFEITGRTRARLWVKVREHWADSERELQRLGFSVAEREQVLLSRRAAPTPYRNTSQLLECVTADHGRVGLVAPSSAPGGQRALLQPFVPLRLSWLRRGELGA